MLGELGNYRLARRPAQDTVFHRLIIALADRSPGDHKSVADHNGACEPTNSGNLSRTARMILGA